MNEIIAKKSWRNGGNEDRTMTIKVTRSYSKPCKLPSSVVSRCCLEILQKIRRKEAEIIASVSDNTSYKLSSLQLDEETVKKILQNYIKEIIK